jgi:TonB-linked outer membrane protein, SusC/RagA family
LNYANKFGDHNVSGLFLFEEQYNNWDSFYAQRVMLLDGEELIYGEDDQQLASMDGSGEKTRQALVGRANYDYKGRYMVDLSFRYDGSSSFPKGARWGFFPAISVGWRISEEAFMKDWISFLDNLKLRASYGKMGDDAGAHTYPQTVVAYEIRKDQIGYFYNGKYMTGVAATAIPNPDLTWYTAKTYNLGLDFDLWNQKLSGTLEVFKRKRDGLLATSSAIIPGTVGASMPQENIESDETFGWEISLGHRNTIAGVTYWVNGQVSATKNRWRNHLDGMAGNSMDNWYRRDVSGRNKDIWFAFEEGGRFNNYNDIRYHGTTGANLGQGTLPGDYWYLDWNGDGIVNDSDRHPVANFNLPVFNYGITLGAAWKGIDLSMNWQGAASVYNSYDEVFTEVAPFNGGAVLDIYKDRWHTVNPTDDPWNPNTQWISGLYPATGHSFNTGTTGIKNTSYLRLKTLEVGYTLPKVWIQKAGIRDVRVYVNAYNLLTITGLDNIDPERPGRQGGANNNADTGILFYNYPVNRTFNIGATIKF